MIIHEVEQNTDEWHVLRAGKPTASDAKKLVTSKAEPSKQMADYAIQLAADLFAGEQVDRWEGNQWTERGHELEDRARAYYENTFEDRMVVQVGFITDDDERYGCSPDSLVDADGMLEIKCLKATNHCKVLMHFDKNNTIPANYIAQPHMQMLVAERKWNDMLFWHPELPPLLYRVGYDERFEVNLTLQIGSCLDERDRIIEVLNRY